MARQPRRHLHPRYRTTRHHPTSLRPAISQRLPTIRQRTPLHRLNRLGDTKTIHLAVDWHHSESPRRAVEKTGIRMATRGAVATLTVAPGTQGTSFRNGECQCRAQSHQTLAGQWVSRTRFESSPRVKPLNLGVARIHVM